MPALKLTVLDVESHEAVEMIPVTTVTKEPFGRVFAVLIVKLIGENLRRNITVVLERFPFVVSRDRNLVCHDCIPHAKSSCLAIATIPSDSAKARRIIWRLV